jgi:hypothetical protein
MITFLQHGGERLGNVLLQNAGLSILAKKFNYSASGYNNFAAIQQLNMKLFSGSIQKLNCALYQDDRLYDLVTGPDTIDHGIIYKGFFQDIKFLNLYRQDIINLFDIPSPSPNNDLFVQVRLTDAERFNPGIEYYKTAINQTRFENAYIASDSIESPIVKELINTYNMNVYDGSDIDTIKFGRQFNNIVISNGTFSWWIAMLSQAQRIFYPKTAHTTTFHPDIYFLDWIGI